MLSRRKLLAISVRAALIFSSLPLIVSCDSNDKPVVRMASFSSVTEYAQAMAGIDFIGPVCIRKSAYERNAAPADVQGHFRVLIEGKIEKAGTGLALEDRIGSVVRADFEAGRIVDINGWKLSETECELAALAASLQGKVKPTMSMAGKPVVKKFLDVEKWGPRKTARGEGFNVQSDGHSGIWVRVENAPASTVLVFAGVSQQTQIYSTHLTSGLRGEFMHKIIDAPGSYEVALLDKARNIIQLVGEFVVMDGPAKQKVMSSAMAAGCGIQRWGPTQSDAGVAFNKQPNGSSAFWIRTDCTIAGSQLILDGTGLHTTIRDGLVTASVPEGHKLAAGKYPLKLRLGKDGKMVKVGTFRVRRQ